MHKFRKLAMNTEIRFPSPFAYSLCSEFRDFYCAHCFKSLKRTPDHVTCDLCNYFKYCDPHCAAAARGVHADECLRIMRMCKRFCTGAQKSIDIPSAIIFYGRLIDRLKIENIEINVQLPAVKGEERGWKHLLTHDEDMRVSGWRTGFFEHLYNGVKIYFGDDDRLDIDELWTIYCKKTINCHGVYANFGDCIGHSLDFGLSAYDHSCSPTVGIHYDGFIPVFRSLDPAIDIRNTDEAYVGYCELAWSTKERRADLQKNWYFECQCSRCKDPLDSILTSVLCLNETCKTPVQINQGMCFVCGFIVDETRKQLVCELVERAVKGQAEWTNHDEAFTNIDSMLMQARLLHMHPHNIIITDLLSSYIQWALKSGEHWTEALLYAEEALAGMKICYPKSHKIIAFHCLKIVNLQLKLQQTPSLEYSLLAKNIFLAWFGPDHRNTVKVAELVEEIQNCTTKGEFSIKSWQKLKSCILFSD